MRMVETQGGYVVPDDLAIEFVLRYDSEAIFPFRYPRESLPRPTLRQRIRYRLWTRPLDRLRWAIHDRLFSDCHDDY